MILELIFLSSFSFAQNTRIENFNQAKKVLNKFDIFKEETLYCGCKIKAKKIDPSSCGYIPPKQSDRAFRLEWEHVVPASVLSAGETYKKSDCKKKSKRQCLEKSSSKYSHKLGDLYNLYAEDGLINQLRSDKPHEELTSSQKSFGKCDIKISSHGFTARKEVKGIIARTYQYMEKAYPEIKVISRKNQKLYEAWNKMYPVNQKECERAKKIESLQKNENPFVKEPCKLKGWY